jgi:catechol 2,3-dioxygenase-like lactoylglutathione lyase family enzyme
MFRGFATLSCYAGDLAAARDWYTELLGVEAYCAASS